MMLTRCSGLLLGFTGVGVWVAGCAGGRPDVSQYGGAGNDSGQSSNAGTSTGGRLATLSGGTSNTTGIFGSDAGCKLTGCEGGAAGQSSTVPAACGDGLINRAEEKCDDGNVVGGDGCTAACDQLEANYVCPTPGQPCVTTVICGDGRVMGSETCDDGKNSTTGQPASNDGCSDSCKLELGWECPIAGVRCRPICGDGLVLGREQCDNGFDSVSGNPVAGDGCDQNCGLEPGWVCPDAGKACRKTVCGDGTKEGSEQCDDGNLRPFDGCSPDCKNEPRCGTSTSPIGKCVSECGDGILLANGDEQCDDGNKVSGDGCSDTCQTEPGFSCTTILDTPPSKVELPVVLRDFLGIVDSSGKTVSNGHPDFERSGGNTDPRTAGIVQGMLDLDRKPIYAGTDAAPIPTTKGKTRFDQWYRDVDGTNQRVDWTLTLNRDASGAYVMNSATDAPWKALGGFFPVDGKALGNQGRSHNFHFTSELRYWFEYHGNETLKFSGDDDVWVFVNGRLVVDIGGIHWPTFGMIRLGSDGRGSSCVETDNGKDNVSGTSCTPNADTNLEMQIGNIYEVVVFQAERHTSDSNYWLTLTNFLAGKSNCVSVCGDGVVTPDEACDLGADNNGKYAGCNADCTLAPYCGDGQLDATAGEQCDDGVNTSLYGGCAPGCVLGPKCGDGQVQSPFEQCDDGINPGGYGKCASNCHYDARCGDGVIQKPQEQCDDGLQNGVTACQANCSPRVIF